MKLILFDMRNDLCEKWRQYFKNEINVEVKHCLFHEIEKFDCVVSPANSFGIMDGGFDAVLTDFFGTGLMSNVQSAICKSGLVMQPVRGSIIVPTGNIDHPYCAHTPTMRVPKQIIGTDNIYNSMRSMLLEVKKYSAIDVVVCPGLGTCTGGVSADVAARQMYLAYMSVFYPKKVTDWKTAFYIDAIVNQ